MSKSQETYNKKEKEKKRLKKKQDKQQKKEDRKGETTRTFEEMLAYVDENGNLTSTPPDPKRKNIINTEDIQISVSRRAEPLPEDLIRKGTVTFFNDSKGYGFIKDDENHDSIFVHVNGLESPIKENDKVTFETEKGVKGLNAVRVKLVI